MKKCKNYDNSRVSGAFDYEPGDTASDDAEKVVLNLQERWNVMAKNPSRNARLKSPKEGGGFKMVNTYLTDPEFKDFNMRYGVFKQFYSDWNNGYKDVTKLQSAVSDCEVTQRDVDALNDLLSKRAKEPERATFCAANGGCTLFSRVKGRAAEGIEKGLEDYGQGLGTAATIDRNAPTSQDVKDFTQAVTEPLAEGLGAGLEGVGKGIFGGLPAWALVAGGVLLLGAAGVYMLPIIALTARTAKAVKTV